MGKHYRIAARTTVSKRTAAPWKKALLVLLMLILAACLSLVGVTWHYLNKIQRPDTNASYMNEDEYNSMVQNEEDAPTGLEEIPPESVVWEDPETLSSPDAPWIKGDVTNILLIGQDRRPGEGRGRSDAIILCSINKTSGRIHLVSFLRDLYVQIPGYQDNRINASYAFGGAPLLNETIEQNFGIHIDANVEVDFNAFISVIDTLGGVDILLTDAEYQYFIDCGHTNTVRGMNHFNGKEALFYSQIRYLDSDFGRTNRQRNVLSALFSSIRGASLTDMIALMDSVLPVLTVDLSNTEIIGYLTKFYPMLGNCEVLAFSIPGEGNYRSASIRGMAVLVPDLNACREQLRSFLSAE